MTDGSFSACAAEDQEQRRVAAVVEDHVGVLAGRPLEDAVREVPVLLERLALVREHRDAAAAIAAAAWSCVEKMLQDAQRTSAPSAASVSMSTAVWIVMCREPAMRAPASGFACAELGAHRHQARHLGLGDRDLAAAEVGLRRCRRRRSP